MKKLTIGIALVASILALGGSIPAHAQSIDIGQLRQLVQLFIAIGVISPEKADAARLLVGLPVVVNISSTASPSNDAIVTPVAPSPITQSVPVIQAPVVQGSLKIISDGVVLNGEVMDNVQSDSIVIKKGTHSGFRVFIFPDSSNINSLRNKTLHVETTDPLGFNRVGGHSGSETSTVTTQDIRGTATIDGRNGFVYGIAYENQTVGANTFTFSVADMNLTKTITVNVTE